MDRAPRASSQATSFTRKLPRGPPSYHPTQSHSLQRGASNSPLHLCLCRTAINNHDHTPFIFIQKLRKTMVVEVSVLFVEQLIIHSHSCNHHCGPLHDWIMLLCTHRVVFSKVRRKHWKVNQNRASFPVKMSMVHIFSSVSADLCSNVSYIRKRLLCRRQSIPARHQRQKATAVPQTIVQQHLNMDGCHPISKKNNQQFKNPKVKQMFTVTVLRWSDWYWLKKAMAVILYDQLGKAYSSPQFKLQAIKKKGQ